MISDMLFIKYQSNKLKEIDTEGLYQVYADILNKFHKKKRLIYILYQYNVCHLFIFNS